MPQLYFLAIRAISITSNKVSNGNFSYNTQSNIYLRILQTNYLQ
jgi:tricorn protease-like protein